MPKLKSIADLQRIREEVQQGFKIRAETGTKIIIGMGTCGIAAGARETMHAILAELNTQGIDAHVTTVGCIGMCSKEPLVDIEQAGKPRITYCNVHPDMAPRLVHDHLISGEVVAEWAMGRVPTAGIGQS
jgi:NADP-reducing hydrogenase subunit HndB